MVRDPLDAAHGAQRARRRSIIRGLGANLVNYPVEARGRFASSDPLLDQLWATGAYTLRQCMHDAWEDCPSREQRQWLGDVDGGEPGRLGRVRAVASRR